MAEDSVEQREIDDKPKRLFPGRRLRAAREAGHISIAEAASHLRLDPQLITALEEDRYENLPGATYICGYLRSYARLLRLPENEIVQAYTQGESVEAAIIPENVNIMSPRRANPRLIRLTIVSLVMLVLTAGFLWVADQVHLFDARNASTTHAALTPDTAPAAAGVQAEPISQPATLAAVEPPAAPTEMPGVQVDAAKPEPKNLQEIRLKYTADSWTEVKDAHGERLIFRLVDKDSELTLRGEAPLWVLLGYAKGVEVYYQGKRFDTKDYTQNDVAIFILGKP